PTNSRLLIGDLIRSSTAQRAVVRCPLAGARPAAPAAWGQSLRRCLRQQKARRPKHHHLRGAGSLSVTSCEANVTRTVIARLYHSLSGAAKKRRWAFGVRR